MNVSERGLQLIKEFERCRLVGYLPTPQDVPTIGWGHTGPEVKIGATWTQEQADAAFALDVEKYERCVNDSVKAPLTQNEFDACVSLAYNIGVGAFRGSTLVRKLNQGQTAGAAEEFERWNKQGGKVLAGLTRRREAERDRFEDVA